MSALGSQRSCTLRGVYRSRAGLFGYGCGCASITKPLLLLPSTPFHSTPSCSTPCSIGTEELFNPLNLFWGVLFWKRQAELEIIRSGLDYTIIRPGGRPLKGHQIAWPPSQRSARQGAFGLAAAL